MDSSRLAAATPCVKPAGRLGVKRLRMSPLVLAAMVAAVSLGCDGELSMNLAPPGDLMAPPPTGGAGGSKPPLPANPEVPLPHACDLRVRELSVYQAVRIPLLQEGQPAAPGSVPLIEGRRSFFRALLGYDGAARPGSAIARLKVESSAGTEEFEASGLVADVSTEAQLESSLNFDVPGALIQADTRVSLTLHVGASCSAGGIRNYPASGPLELSTTDTGVLKIVLVPIQYDADGSGRLPTMTDAQVQRYRDLLIAIYPTRAVELTVREPVASGIELVASVGGWPNLLDALRELRDSDGAARDVYYYGLVEPAANFTAYCRSSCVTGLSFLVDSMSGSRQVGIGLGFPGNIAAETLIHEIGHEHGRGHSPCGGGAGIDRAYPHDGGGIGEWGLDLRTQPPRLQSPTTRKDMMGYCNPQWISDYTYAAIATRRSAVSNMALAARQIRQDGRQPLWSGDAFESQPPGRTLLLDGAGGAVWGSSWRHEDSASGKPEIARVLDESGAVIAEVTVYRTGYGHGPGASLAVPAARSGWVALALDGLPDPIPFAAPSTVPSLQPSRGVF
jgi:hypothetical protein